MPLEPQPKEPESMDKDSTDYVEVGRNKKKVAAFLPERHMFTFYAQVPLDVVMAYHTRLARCASCIPPQYALSWIQSRDEEERQQWVDKHRRTALSLGKIIKDSFERREHMWEFTMSSNPMAQPAPPAAFAQSAPAPPLPKRSTRPPARPPVGAGGWEGVADKSLATHLKNGKELCKSYNRGSCPEPCPRNHEHACSMIVNKSGRVCGMRNHSAAVCRKAPTQPF